MSATDQGALPAKAAHRPMLAVRLAPQVVSRLSAEARTPLVTGIEVGGLLFGRPENDLAYIHECKSFSEIDSKAGSSPQGEDRDELFYSLMLSSRTDPEVSGFDLIGWYSVRLTGGLHQSDIEFHERHFRRPSDMALILRSESDAHLLELYARSPDGMLTSEAHRSGALRLSKAGPSTEPVEIAMRGSIRDDFYLRAYEIGKALDNAERREQWKSTVQSTKRAALSVFWPERAKASEGSQPADSTEDAVVHRPDAAIVRRQQGAAPMAAGMSIQRMHAEEPTESPVKTARKERTVPWLWSGIVFVLVALATFGMVLLYGLPAGSVAPGFLRALLPSAGLRLRAEGQGDRILLSWNRSNRVVRSAKQGVLQIVDGSQHRDVPLDSGQVSNGSVLYRASSGDVTFRLEVYGNQGAMIAESTRVLDSTKSSDSGTGQPVADASTRTAHNEIAAQVPGRELNSTGERITLPDTRSLSARNNAVPNAKNPIAVASPSSEITGRAASKSTPDGSAFQPDAPNSGAPRSNAERTSTAAPHLRSSDTSSALLSPPALQGDLSPADSASNLVAWDVPVPPKPGQGGKTPETRTPDKLAVQSPTRALGQQQAPSPVTGSIAYIAPVPIRQVLPDVKAFAPGVLTGMEEIDVEVSVDKTGHVEEAQVAHQGGKLRMALVRATLSAARQWVFQPAMLHGVPVASKHTIVFQFHPAAR